MLLHGTTEKVTNQNGGFLGIPWLLGALTDSDLVMIICYE